ncbi:endonuclease/exonuclease/phosphatase family protein [Nocardioides caeni]|uniref:Endonuclease/exonuclease/phosphatase domain-containing protein n=1 Tax=Nocardioides caeni TaxID=574700 RepID=A0A4S8NMH3_9ACTN|nr:endonuclease/exonuclease/phosphatase family protein [Nocardioides caeni]THV18183.1 hypothetical protein E9934_00590 [Nocardioides caeni]
MSAGLRRTAGGFRAPGTLLTAVLLLALALAAGEWGRDVLTPTAAESPRVAQRTDGAVSEPIRIVQANIKSGMANSRTREDVNAVYRRAPDFVTFNEVTYRPDSMLLRDGYALFRTPGAYKGETPVAWNTARWTLIGSGTHLISNRKRPAGTSGFELGIRYANWITVQSASGQTVSVVSTHFSPEGGYTAGITAPSLRRLGLLVAGLRAAGPVLVGGDLNANYKNASDYPRSTMKEAGLTPTYDVMGAALATGVYRNATIDYILLGAAEQFQVLKQWVQDINSDHRLLFADVAMVGAGAVAFSPGVVTNDPVDAPNTVAVLVRRILNKAPAGATVHVITRRIDGSALLTAIEQARARGVNVQVMTRTKAYRASAAERRLIRVLGTRTSGRSWILRVSGATWDRWQLPTASVLASASGGATALRTDINRPLVPASARVATRARIQIGKTAYDALWSRKQRASGWKP